ncbi:hypothetical protein BC829DRAFT_419905 [Chytridium lagenaria]|nr:hypothetical protein BC829DRAFT_419905 [Chytridium lagenaria]
MAPMTKDHRLAEFVSLVIHRIWSSSSFTSSRCPPSPPLEPRLQTTRHRLLVYVRRLLRCPSISTQMIVLALLFIARLREINAKEPVREGAELLDDDRVDNVAWVEFAGVDLRTMNGMEREFLAKIRWQVHVGQNEYHEFIRKLKVIAEELPGGAIKDSAHSTHTMMGLPAPPRPPVTPPPDVYEANGDVEREVEERYRYYKQQLNEGYGRKDDQWSYGSSLPSFEHMSMRRTSQAGY